MHSGSFCKKTGVSGKNLRLPAVVFMVQVIRGEGFEAIVTQRDTRGFLQFCAGGSTALLSPRGMNEMRAGGNGSKRLAEFLTNSDL